MGNVFSLTDLILRACICAAAVVVLNGAESRADQLEEVAKRLGVRILSEGTSESAVLNFTKTRIPYAKMSARSQQRASRIVGDISQYRRMPSLQFKVDPGVYQYLINHPDVAISTWRVMGISKLQMFQTGEFEYEATAPDGSEGIADVLWRDANQCLFIVQGKYSSPLLPSAIHASALVWLQYRFVDNKDGTYLVNQQVEAFINFPSSAVDAIAKVASRVTNTILDRNVFEVSLYARMMSQAAEKEPDWIEQVAQRMDGVLPNRRMELVQVARGQKPAVGRMLPTVSDVTTAEQHLPKSGQFREFEYSMHQLNQHVPLIPGEVEHQPSYGQKIGSKHAWMSQPHEYMPEEAQKAIAEKEEKRQRAIQYNLYYSNPDAKGVPEFVVPQQIPPSMHGGPRSAVADLMDSPTPLTFTGKIGDSKAYGKASTKNLPQSGTTPVSRGNGSGKSSTQVPARTVSRTKSRSSSPGSQKPVDDTPPLQTHVKQRTQAPAPIPPPPVK